MKSASSVCPLSVFALPSKLFPQTLVEATAMRRAQAHRRLLRKVKTELEILREQEKVKGPINKSKQKVDRSMIPLQVVTDAKTLVKRYKKLLRQ